MRPTFYYQKIFDESENVTAVEIFTRNYPVNERTDLYLFVKLLKKLKKEKITFNVPIHVNLYPSTIPLVDWETAAPLLVKKNVVIEVLEEDVYKYRHYIRELIEWGIKFALDDFGDGNTNFALLWDIPFPIVKVNAEVVPPKVVESLKEDFGTQIVIAEKCCDFDFYPSDWFQCFELHEPEPILQEKT